MAARVYSHSSGHLPRPLNTSPFASARVFPCSCVMFAANASCIKQSLKERILFAAFARHEATRPDHVFSDQLLKLEHDTLSVRDWSAFPSRKGVLSCLNSLLELIVCDDWHPGNNFLGGLHALGLSIRSRDIGACSMAQTLTGFFTSSHTLVSESLNSPLISILVVPCTGR